LISAKNIVQRLHENKILVTASDGKLIAEAAKGKITPEFAALIRENKHALLEFLQDSAPEVENRKQHIPLLERNAENRYEPSFAQRRLWIISQIEQGGAEYNMPMALKMSGDFRPEIAEAAIKQIIRRHESLRTVFEETENGPVQIINEQFSFALERFELTSLYGESLDNEIQTLVRNWANHEFDLCKDVMIKVGYASLPSEGQNTFDIQAQETQASEKQTAQWLLLFNMHHIASDGWSLGVVVSEFVKHYQALLNHQADPLPPLEVQYADYAYWQKSWLQGEVLEQQLSYWRQHLQGVPALHGVGLDFPRPKIKQHVGQKLTKRLPDALSHQLQKLALKQQVTLFMLLHAAVGLLISRHSNSDDVVLGTPMANRRNTQLEPLIGFFVNTLVLRIRTDFEGFEQYLAHVRDINMQAQANQDLPFEYLVEHLQLPRSTAHTPLFQIIFKMDNFETEDLSLPDLQFSSLEQREIKAKFDLEITAKHSKDNIDLSWEYDTALFTESHIETLHQHLENLLNSIVVSPQAQLNKLTMLTEPEASYLLKTLNNTQVAWPQETQIQALFEQQAMENGQQTALVFREQVISYEQLNKEANRLAHYLREQGVGVDTLVGVCMERSVDMVVSLLAILKAGGAYVPMAPDYPVARLQYVLEDTGLKHLLIQSRLLSKLNLPETIQLTVIDEQRAEFQSYSDANLRELPEQHSGNLVYVIYTSGSTGQPKGVMLEHKALMNRIHWMQAEYQLQTVDRVLQKTPFSFDVSVWEFFWTLGYGATLVIAEPGGHKDPDYLNEVIAEQGITRLHFVPSMLNAYLTPKSSRFAPQVKDVFCSGEALALDVVERAFERAPHINLHNLYGPTEAAIDVSFFDCSRSQELKCVPIGKPIQNTQLLVLDQQLNLCPLGVTGELYIGGVGLARGYLNKAELTKERFIQNPYDVAGERIYRTGDLARYLPTGDIEYIGRIDEQVKLRGFRIELGEIQSLLQQFPGVDDSLVLIQQSVEQHKYLNAYIQPTQQLLNQSGVQHQHERVEQWQNVFDDAYTRDDSETKNTLENAIGKSDLAFESDLAGWNCSYRNQAIPSAEMLEWVDGTVQSIKELKPKRLLEIGVGTGLLLYRYGPYCEEVHATDISGQALDKLAAGIRHHQWQHVHLSQTEAHDLSAFHGMKFDTIVLNSVAQYFPGKEYFKEVLQQMLACLCDGGKIFLGDLRNLDLFSAFSASVAIFQAQDDSDAELVRQKALLSGYQEEELFFSPSFFARLADENEDISQVDILLKAGISSNEMMRYRYDVVLHKQSGAVSRVSQWHQWQNLADFKHLLQQKQHSVFGISGMVNERITHDVAASVELNNKTCDITALQSAISMAQCPDTENLRELASEAGYEMKMSWNQQFLNRLDLIFFRKDCQVPPQIFAASPYLQKRDTNAPQLRSISQQLIPELKAWMSDHLPDFMLPSGYLLMDEFPKNSNGKIEKTSFPRLLVADQGEYIAAQNDIEEAIQNIWQKLLNQDKVSVEANFFELGGDSILAIQAVSRAARQGWHFSVKDVLSTQTIRRLAKVVRLGSNVEAVQEEVKGDLPLLPIQRAFFDDETELHQFNQSVLLNAPEQLTFELLHQMIEQLYHRHDALRLIFSKRGEQWQAEHRPLSELQISAVVELKELNSSDPQEMQDYANQIQQSLDPKEGLLMRAALIKGAKGGNRLLLVIHHLVVDGVSWRILLADLERLFAQHLKGATLGLESKTSSYQQWAQFLTDYTASGILDNEKPFWQSIVQSKGGSFVDFTKAESLLGQRTGEMSFFMDVITTQQLLTQCHHTYRTKTDELLLAGLLLAVHRCSDKTELRIDIEGHGREHLTERLDLSDTVGWFTSLFPVLLQMETGHSEYKNDQLLKELQLKNLVCGVKEQLQGVPNKGIGFGLLKYLANPPEFSHSPNSELLFNYLGHFDQVTDSDNYFVVAQESSGENVSRERRPSHGLMLNVMVLDGCLNFSLSYEQSRYDEVKLRELQQQYQMALKDIAKQCLSSKPRLTPADFELSSISQTELDGWQRKREIHDLYPATGMQQGLLFDSMKEPGSYVTQTILGFEHLNLDYFRQAWQQVIVRHSVLRTSFVGIETGNTQQLVQTEAQLSWQVQDLSSLRSEKQAAAVEAARIKDKMKGFDITEACLMRVTVLKLGSDTVKVIWSNHHALMDGWCLPLVFGELSECYRALIEQEAPELTVPYAYRDYVAWLQMQDWEKARNFWQEQVNNMGNAVQMPFPAKKHPNLELGTQDLIERQLSFNSHETGLLKSLAQRNKTTVNVLLQAAWALLLSRYNGDSQAVFGCVTSGRPAGLAGVDKMTGLFINTLPVCIELDNHANVAQWLQKIHQQWIERDSFSYLPLQEIQQLSDTGQALFNSLIVFENYPIDEVLEERASEAGLVVKDIQSFDESNYDITLQAHMADTLSIGLHVQSQCMDERAVVQIAGHLKQVLLSLSESANRSVSDVQMLSSEEEHYLVHELNEQANLMPQHKLTTEQALLHELFEGQAQSLGESPALVFDGQVLSYREVNEQANQLARYLQEQGVGNETLVGIYVQRSAQMVIGLLAILKAGGAYVPFDAKLPGQRLGFMLEDTQLKYLLTDEALRANVLDYDSVQLMCFGQNSLQSAVQAYPKVNLPRQSTPSSLAYVIYTSGSTGQAKGVMVEHAGLANLALSLSSRFALSAQSEILQLAAFGFDAATWDISMALCSGATLHLIQEDRVLSPAGLGQYVREQSITYCFVPPALLSLLDVADFQTVKTMTIGGEAASPEVARIWAKGRALYNAYGPTENTVVATIDRIYSDTQRLSIGRPIDNVSCFVLDEQQNLVPPGGQGELCLGGIGVARGYLNRPQESQRQFIEERGLSAGRLYRTGDEVRYLADGRLEFIGRLDEQVKIRGVRIEPGEIEFHLMASELVRGAVVMAREFEDQAKRLVAWVVPGRNWESGNSEPGSLIALLRSDLHTRVADYMVPSVFICIDEIPLTSNGKVDKKALPEVSLTSLPQEYVAPETDTEMRLTEIWAELLELDKSDISVTAHFFELGGHSLLVMQLINMVNEAFQVDYEIKDFLADANIRMLSKSIKQHTEIAQIEHDRISDDVAELSDDEVKSMLEQLGG